jgi:FtsH-binding integral membrane protein
VVSHGHHRHTLNDTTLNDEEAAMTVTISHRTTVHTRPLSDSSDSLLRFAMRADATLCAGTGLLIASADPLSRVSGLSAASEWIAGAALVVYGLVLYVLAAAPDIRRIGVGIVAANVVFAVAVTAVLVSGVLPLTAAGVAMSVATVAIVLGFAVLQYLGVRRLA